MNEGMHFYKWLKVESESYWEKLLLDRTVYGFQVQPGTCWNKGLSDEEIKQFEKALQVEFTDELKSFYKVMNGTNKPVINVYGDSGKAYAYSSLFYSYPQDLELIKKQIQSIHAEFKVDLPYLKKNKISAILPLYKHHCILLQEKGNPVLSMYGTDVIPLAPSIRECLLKEIFADEMEEEEENYEEQFGSIKFWLDK